MEDKDLEMKLFSFLKENLSIEIESSEDLVGGVGGHSEKTIEVSVKLKNPETQEEQVISKYSTPISD